MTGVDFMVVSVAQANEQADKLNTRHHLARNISLYEADTSSRP
jgi:hypothetical protein